MSQHTQIVQFLRDSVAKDQNDLGKHLRGFTDEQVFHKLFMSFRGKSDESKGLRLTWLGYRLLSTYTQSFEVSMPEAYRLGSRDLLYLDARAKMPYYIGRGEDEDGGTRLIVFEAKLGIMLKLADGMISNLREMEA
jgi:hypothetical protein